MATGHDIYYYKMTADTGFAPCVDGHRLLTLATCKPGIRKFAVPDDTIIGFSSNSDGARLIYTAKVTRKLSDGDYFKDHEYAKRLDCIYENRAGRAVLRPGINIPGHNTQADIERDVGTKFGHGHVLLSDQGDFRYFGKDGTEDYAKRFPRLAEAVQACTQGYRISHAPEVHRDLLNLVAWLWETYGPGVRGKPTKPLRGNCGGCGAARPRSCRS